jgi:hypothetical protein
MLPKVKMHITFCTDQTSIEAPSVHLTDDADLDPKKLVDLVYRKKILVVDKLLYNFEFESVCQNISNVLFKKPDVCIPFGGANPDSLVDLASRAASKTRLAHQVATQPQVLIEAEACNLTPEEIYKFYKLNGESLQNLKKIFTENGLQKFLIHFYKTLDSCEKSCQKSLLKSMKNNFYYEMYKMSIVKPQFHFDWVFASLGLDNLYSVRDCWTFRYFQAKFRRRLSHLRFPIPTIPFAFSRLVPTTLSRSTLDDLITLDDDFSPFTNQIVLPKNQNDIFLLLLSAFEESLWRDSLHEVFAYATEIVGFHNYDEHPFGKKFYLYLWGGLAVTCAKLFLPSIIVSSCLHKASIRLVTLSDQIDFQYYKQQVFSEMDMFEFENIAFLEIMDMGTKQSFIYEQAISVHLQTLQNKFFKQLVVFYRKFKNNMWYESEYIFVKKNEFDKCVKKQMRNIHRVLAETKSDSLIKKCKEYLAMFELIMELNNVIAFFENATNIERLHNLFRDIELPIKHFICFWNKHTSLQTYEQDLKDLRRYYERQTRIKNSLPIAHNLTMHYLCFQFCEFEHLRFKNELFEEIVAIYKKHFHPMGSFLVNNLSQNVKFDWPDKLDDPYKSCSLSWVIKNGPRVKELTRLGVISAERFDIWNKGDYWQPPI